MARAVGHIRILISASLLLDLEEANKIFKEKGTQEYADYIRARGKYEKDFKKSLGGREFAKGPLWNFAMAAKALNKPGEDPVVEIGVVSKDTGETGLTLLRNLDTYGLMDDTATSGFAMMTAGKKLTLAHLESFGTDLLLTRNVEDVQLAVDNGIAAAVMDMPPEGTAYASEPGKPLRIWVDGDGVAVGSSSEVVYRRDGLEKYLEHVTKNFNEPIEPGPLTHFLAKISALNANFPAGEQPFELSLLTARSLASGAHMIKATEKLGIVFNGGLNFMCEAPKAPMLKAHRPDIFFDDQPKNLDPLYCPNGLVAYPAGSAMGQYLKENKEDITVRKAPVVKAPVKKAQVRRSTRSL